MRDRLREGSFGYDHSQILGLHLEGNDLSSELTDQAFSKLLIQKVREHKTDHKMTYQEWKRKKDTEDRIRRNLKMKFLRNYYEETLVKEQNDEERHLEGKKKVREWMLQKYKESKGSGKGQVHDKSANEELEREKIQKTDENYRNWLREKLGKANQEKIERRRKRRRECLRQKEREIELKLRSEQAVQQWLHSKSKASSRGSTIRMKRKSQSKTRNPLKVLSSQHDYNQRVQIKEVKYNKSTRPPLHRAAIHIEEFNSFSNRHGQCENNNPESSSMSFLSESYESI